MRKTITIKTYGRVDPRLEDKRRRLQQRPIRKPFTGDVKVSPKEFVAA